MPIKLVNAMTAILQFVLAQKDRQLKEEKECCLKKKTIICQSVQRLIDTSNTKANIAGCDGCFRLRGYCRLSGF